MARLGAQLLLRSKRMFEKSVLTAQLIIILIKYFQFSSYKTNVNIIAIAQTETKIKGYDMRIKIWRALASVCALILAFKILAVTKSKAAEVLSIQSLTRISIT